MRPLALVLLATLLPTAHANSYVPPRPLLIGSEFSDYGFKFLPRGVDSKAAKAKESWGELIQLQPDGTVKTLWKRKLVNTPSRILISPRGQVVTLDNWAGYESPRHAVVVYDLKGKVTADLNFSQVVTNPKACPRCHSMDGPFLTNGYTPKFFLYGDGNE